MPATRDLIKCADSSGSTEAISAKPQASGKDAIAELQPIFISEHVGYDQTPIATDVPLRNYTD